MSEEFFIGIDVGTGSARAALVTSKGYVSKIATHPIKTWNDVKDNFEQSSDDIWQACCRVVKEVVADTRPEKVVGIGIDATCSLVAIDKQNRPVTVSLSGKREQNVILWMDHRASSEAAFINSEQPEVLKYVGDAISLEMETPKLMWLKKNLPETWRDAKYFFDLSDFLTWRATNDDSRSLCSVVCKWTFVAGSEGHKGWDPDYFSLVKLDDLLENNAVKIGSKVKASGEPCGSGLTPAAAKELGLLPGTPVGTGIIDAHAGGLGLLGCSAEGVSSDFATRIGLICGTSTCHMAVSQTPIFVPGVWGPYYSAMVPNMWLNEAGQSATGKLIDHVIETHPAAAMIDRTDPISSCTMSVYDSLNITLNRMAGAKGLRSVASLTARLHVWPDFHGNRSPLADPTILGMISGLSLSSDVEDLALKYLATIQALAYGTRHILDTLVASGYKKLSCVLMCGGLAKNEIFVQTHANVLGIPVLLPSEKESVLLGAAMLGAVAAKRYASVQEAVKAMGGAAKVYEPVQEDVRYHTKKYKVFLKMIEDQRSYDAIMTAAP